MKMIVELGNRVFEMEALPDGPGVRHRTLTATLLSGPPLTREEYDRVTREVVADMVARGVDVYSWSGIPAGPGGPAP